MERATLIPGADSAGGVRLQRRAMARRLVTVAADAVVLWLERARQRRALQRLDDRMLRDIGLTRVDVARESDKPFWRG